MLNEAWQLRRALERSGVAMTAKHPRIKIPGGSMPCLRVRLSEKGTVSAVEEVPKDNWPNWTIMEGKQSSFPVVRVKKAMLTISSDEWPTDQDLLSYLPKLWQKFRTGISFDAKEKKLWERLRNKKSSELENSCKHGDATLSDFAQRFSKVTQDPMSLMDSIGGKVIEALHSGQLTDAKTVQLLLIGKQKPKSGRADTDIQLAFDLDSQTIYTNKHLKTVTACLPHQAGTSGDDHGKTHEGCQGTDALSGKSEKLEDGCFPEVNLPTPSGKNSQRIGRKSFPLSSMFSAAECNYRYGMTDTGVFPIGRDTAIGLKEAIEKITSDDCQNKTWAHVPSGHFSMQGGRKIEKKDLLIVYPEDEPSISAEAALFFGTGPDTVASQFHADCQVVCDAFRGVLRTPHSTLKLFLIREMSKGQAQVALAESPAITDVLEGAGRWNDAAGNVPDVALWIQANKKSGRSTGERQPLPPYPGQVVELLSHQWVRGGTANQPLVGIGLATVLSLMLRVPGKWQDAARQMLAMLVQRISPLLIGLFGAKHSFSQDALSRYNESARWAALQAVALAGILLDAFDRRKDTYMSGPAFQVGQVLALADTLHKDYCTVVRKGQMPNVLIGTALMRRAMDSPIGSLADLSERMMEYVRWAKTAIEPREAREDDPRRIAVREARKTLRRYQPLAAALASQDLPRECSETDKAELLLGFLASPQDIDNDNNRKDAGNER